MSSEPGPFTAGCRRRRCRRPVLRFLLRPAQAHVRDQFIAPPLIAEPPAGLVLGGRRSRSSSCVQLDDDEPGSLGNLSTRHVPTNGSLGELSPQPTRRRATVRAVRSKDFMRSPYSGCPAPGRVTMSLLRHPGDGARTLGRGAGSSPPGRQPGPCRPAHSGRRPWGGLPGVAGHAPDHTPGPEHGQRHLVDVAHLRLFESDVGQRRQDRLALWARPEGVRPALLRGGGAGSLLEQ